jgi:Zn finger protein HypA/HybF involved in hydrogenase expression
MSRAQKIITLVEDIGGANLRLKKDQKFLQCRSCGYTASMPSGVYGTDALGDSTRAPLLGEAKEKCPKCGKPMNEVSFTSARVMRGMGGQGYSAPGGALNSRAYS